MWKIQTSTVSRQQEPHEVVSTRGGGVYRSIFTAEFQKFTKGQFFFFFNFETLAVPIFEPFFGPSANDGVSQQS